MTDSVGNMSCSKIPFFKWNWLPNLNSATNWKSWGPSRYSTFPAQLWAHKVKLLKLGEAFLQRRDNICEMRKYCCRTDNVQCECQYRMCALRTWRKSWNVDKFACPEDLLSGGLYKQLVWLTCKWMNLSPSSQRCNMSHLYLLLHDTTNCKVNYGFQNFKL